MCASTESIKSKKRRHMIETEKYYENGKIYWWVWKVYIKYGNLLSIKTWKHL